MRPVGTKLPDMITIGYVGEQNSRVISLDISDELQMWPDSTPFLSYMRPTETEVYLAVTTLENGILQWVPDAFATEIEGFGSVQIVFAENRDSTLIIGKSAVIPLRVKRSLEDGEMPTEADETFLAAITAQAERAISAAEEAGRYVELLEMSAANAGYMFVEIDENGHLIFIRSENVNGIDLGLEDGRLIAEWL